MSEATCEMCGAPATPVGKLVHPDANSLGGWADGGTLRLGLACSNPDCPSVESEMAPLADSGVGPADLVVDVHREPPYLRARDADQPGG